MSHCADPPDRAGAIRVFVCYGHDSEDHKELVRQLVTFLRVHGIDANMDVWDDNERRDWPPGQLSLIKSSDYVSTPHRSIEPLQANGYKVRSAVLPR